MYARQDQDSTAAVTPRLPRHHAGSAASALDHEHSGEVSRAVRGARVRMLRWLAGRQRVTGLALAAAGWAAILAAVIAGRHLDRGAVVQIAFAITMVIVATGETLLSSAGPVITDDRALRGAAVRSNGLGTVALVTACLLGPSAGGAALGAGWGTSVLTALAVACALASLAAHRLGR